MEIIGRKNFDSLRLRMRKNVLWNFRKTTFKSTPKFNTLSGGIPTKCARFVISFKSNIRRLNKSEF